MNRLFRTTLDDVDPWLPFRRGALFVVVIVPALAWLAVFFLPIVLSGVEMGRPTVLTVAAGIVVQLDFSPIITLPTMTFAMPRAFQAFLCGYAGPVSAIDLGGVAGCLVGVLMVLIDWPTRWTLATLMNGPLFLATLGFVFGALYWLGARLMAPNAHAWRRAAEAEAASAH